MTDAALASKIEHPVSPSAAWLCRNHLGLVPEPGATMVAFTTVFGFSFYWLITGLVGVASHDCGKCP